MPTWIVSPRLASTTVHGPRWRRQALPALTFQYGLKWMRSSNWAARGTWRSNQSAPIELMRGRGGDQAGGAADGEQAPVAVAPDRLQVGQVAVDQQFLAVGEVVEWDIRDGDVANPVRRQPVAVGARREAGAEELELVGFRLPFPAAGQRELGRDVVGLPAVPGRRDLDADRFAAGAGLQLGQQRRVEVALHGGVGRGAGDVADRTLPLQVEERDGEQHEQQPALGAACQRQHDQRARDQVAEADDVAAHRVRDREGGEQGDAVEGGGAAQQPLTLGQDEVDEQGDGERPEQAGEDERLGPGGREGEGHDRDRSGGAGAEGGTLAALAD